MRIRAIHYRAFRESLDSQHAAGRYNPSKVIKCTIEGTERQHVLPVGDSDSWEIYEHAGRVFCVSINYGLPYVGVQGYDPEDQEPREELSGFFQGSEQVDQELGRDALERLTERTIARRLIERLEEVTA